MTGSERCAQLATDARSGSDENRFAWPRRAIFVEPAEPRGTQFPFRRPECLRRDITPWAELASAWSAFEGSSCKCRRRIWPKKGKKKEGAKLLGLRISQTVHRPAWQITQNALWRHNTIPSFPPCHHPDCIEQRWRAVYLLGELWRMLAFHFVT